MRLPVVFLLLAALVALAGCGGGQGTAAPPPRGVLTVAPASVLLNPGDTQGFRALDATGAEVVAAWSLEGGPGSALSADGHFTAPATTGTYRIRADRGGAAGEATVSVLAAPIVTPSRLGIWLWRLERIGIAATHAELAGKLRAMGVRRVFVKLADGSLDNSRRIGLPLDDATVAPAYHARGLEVWAWSYNYPGSATYHRDQAGALLAAARHGYDGYVLDVEAEFEGALPSQIADCFAAFADARDEAVREGLIPASSALPMFCTTFGNVGADLPAAQRHPLGGHFTQAQLQAIDARVDGWMPQTYLEAWNQMKAPARFIAEGNRVYRACGLVKPLWHITQTELGRANAGDVGAFFAEARRAADAEGLNTSLWSIPNAGQTNPDGQKVDALIWDVQRRIEWRMFDPR